jgi:hypothetical protein
VLRVPPSWTVDTGAISALGRVADNRPLGSGDRSKPIEAEASAPPAPRLVLRGLVVFGRLTITS